jgi:N-acetyl-anhydromuramyl-L-alanine amidase AmpD
MNTFYVDKIRAKETRFRATLKDAYGKTFTEEPSTTIDGAIRLKHPNDGWYYLIETPKDKIVLHFTAGVLHGDIGALTTDQHVSVAYVVARSGETYELFDPKYWSYHLGRGATGGNKAGSASSIGVEISNFGPLELDEEKGILKTWSDKDYCSIDQTDEYVYVAEGFRGKHYFATFTDEQYRTVDSLITNLCRKFNILRKLPSKSDREIKFTSAPGEGIWSHQNFRADKHDMGPAFDWSRISGR